MRKFSNKMVLSVLTLVLLVVALGTTTFAWFTVGNTVTVESFQTEVKSAYGLDMRYMLADGETPATGSDWVRSISGTDMLTYLEQDYTTEVWTDFKLDEVTSVDGKVFKKIGLDYQLGSDLTRTDGYIEFKLQFRTAEADQSLAWTSAVITSEGVPWTPGTTFNKVGGGEQGLTEATYYAAGATRVSATGTETIVYEKVTGADNAAVLSKNQPNWTAGAHDYYKKVMNKDLSTIYGNPNYASNPSGHYEAAETVTALNNASKLGALTAPAFADGYYYITVTIRVYLEGFDSEMFDAILEDKLFVELGFTLVPTV